MTIISSLPFNPTNTPSEAVSPVSSFVKWIKALLLFGECTDNSLVGDWFIPILPSDVILSLVTELVVSLNSKTPFELLILKSLSLSVSVKNMFGLVPDTVKFPFVTRLLVAVMLVLAVIAPVTARVDPS